MRCAIYARVSTSDQTSDNQLPALRTLAHARGMEIVAEISETMSGAKKARPGLTKLLQGAHRGEYQAVLVVAIDRLGRSMQGVINTVLDLDRRNVQVISLREPWLEMGGPTRELLLSIFGWVAQQERQSIIDRTNAGLARARAEGKRLGRPRASVDLAVARRLIDQGTSVRRLAEELRVSVSTAHGIAARVRKSSRADAQEVPAVSAL